MSATEPIAAVIKRYREERHQTSDHFHEDDAFTLADAFIREHDETPITSEGLVADGWEKAKGENVFYCRCEVIVKTSMDVWISYGMPVTTIGQVRTLLRVFGG